MSWIYSLNEIKRNLCIGIILSLLSPLDAILYHEDNRSTRLWQTRSATRNSTKSCNVCSIKFWALLGASRLHPRRPRLREQRAQGEKWLPSGQTMGALS